jgi:DUF2975 family protein
MAVIPAKSAASVVLVVLNALWGLVALAIALTFVLIFLAPVIEGPAEVSAGWLGVGTRMTIPVAVSVDSADRVQAPALGIDGAQLRDVRGSLQFASRLGPFFVANVVLILTLFGLALWLLGNLRAVFRTVRAGRPFVRANAARLRWIAAILIAGEVVRAAIVYFDSYYAMTHFAATGLRFDVLHDFDVSAIFAALIILALAEVFNVGTALDEEQSLTV